MTPKILSNMLFPIEPRGNFECVTNVPREFIDDRGQAFISAIDNLYTGGPNDEGMPVGSDILVKITDASGDFLLHRRVFTLVSASRGMKTWKDGRGVDITADIRDYVFEPVGDWWSSSAVPVEEELTTEKDIGPQFVKGEGYEKWNPGKKTFDIHEIDAESKEDRVVATERNKERARLIAAGSEPLPRAA